MAKSKELGLELTSGSGVSFETWRKSINGDNDGEIVELSNMQILDEAIGELQEVATTIKDNIKDAIEDKGVIVGETPFNEYHLKVAEIGEGNSLPQLNAPTISRVTNTLTVTNPATNGNFLQKVKLLDGDTVKLEKATTGNTTMNLLELGSGNFDLSVKASNPNFRDSVKSNSVSYSIYTITSNLTDLTTSSSVEVVSFGDNYTTTLTPSSGMYLPTNILVTMGGVTIYNYAYNNDTGSLSILNISGNIVITAMASIYTKLDTPVITLDYDTLSWSAVTNAEEYSIIVDNQELDTTTSLNYNLVDLELPDNIYQVSVIAKAPNYQNSTNSSSVEYKVGVIVFGVTGLNLVNNPLTRTDDSVGMGYYINSSTGVITTDFDEYFPEEYVGDNVEPIFYNHSNTRWENGEGEAHLGNVFRKINKFYKQVKTTTSGSLVVHSGFKIALANSKPAGFYCPTYFINEEGQEMDYVLIGVYYSNFNNSTYNTIFSKSNINTNSIRPTQVLKQSALNVARLNSTDRLNMFVKDWRLDRLLIDLFYIIFNTRNHKSIFDTTPLIYPKTGYTDIIKHTAQHGFIITAGVNSKNIIFLGIENFIGYGYAEYGGEYCSGIFVTNISSHNYNLHYSTTPSNYNEKDPAYTTIASYPYLMSSTTQYIIVNTGYDINQPDLALSVATQSTSDQSTYYCSMDNSRHETYYGLLTKTYHPVGLIGGFGRNTSNYTNINTRLCAQPWGVR